MLFFLLQVLNVATFASNSNEIAAGFIQGLRYNQKVESICLKSILTTENYYEVFLGLDFEFAETKLILNAFKVLVNEFTLSVNVCKVESLADFMVSLFNVKNMNNYQIYLATKAVTLSQDYSSYQSAVASQNYYNQGFYAGKIFSILFKYTI